MERHDGDDSIKCAKAPNMLRGFPDKARVNRGSWIHAERVKAKFPQAVNKAAVTTPNVEDSGTRGKHRRYGRVEVLPPPGVCHAQKISDASGRSSGSDRQSSKLVLAVLHACPRSRSAAGSAA
jgi:hypothetical protein